MFKHDTCLKGRCSRDTIKSTTPASKRKYTFTPFQIARALPVGVGNVLALMRHDRAQPLYRLRILFTVESHPYGGIRFEKREAERKPRQAFCNHTGWKVARLAGEVCYLHQLRFHIPSCLFSHRLLNRFVQMFGRALFRQ